MTQVPMGSIPSLYAEQLGPAGWAVRYGEEILTWGDLADRSRRRAHALKAAGLKKGDLLTLSLPNGIDFIELTFATWMVGATPHIVSSQLPLTELKEILALARPRLIISADKDIRERTGAKHPDFCLENGNDHPLEVEVAPHWKALSSGGSTGRPKIIVDELPSIYDTEKRLLDLPAEGTIFIPGPLFHAAPFVSTHTALFCRSQVVGMERFDAEEALRLIDAYKPDWTNLVPTMMLRIWRLPEAVKARYDLSSLKSIWHMAAPMPIWLKEAWIEWLGAHRIHEYYGSSEGVGNSVISGEEWLAHRGSVGKPADCEIRILDEEGAELPSGEVGEIYFKPNTGTGTTYHYLGAVSERTTDGYESVGDFGWFDDDGYLYIADRRTDMIVSGGENIYPAEVESALLGHPDIEAAVVIGLPHEDLGASVHAIIRVGTGAAPSSADLRAFLADSLVRYKIPRSFEVSKAGLRDDAGKVRRSQLRQERLSPAARERFLP